MKVAFFGTPSFAVESLRALHESSEHEVVCVVTQPDRVSGRGQISSFSPVKQFAIENMITVYQPERISKSIDECPKIKDCDVIVTCAFGQILRQNVIDYCRFGVINVHYSVLPKYRGACPVNMAIVHGETKTGITIMQTDIGVDTGDIWTIEEINILPQETTGELLERLSPIGAKLLVKTLTAIESESIHRVPQDNDSATYYPMLKKEDGRIDMTKSPRDIVNFVRGMNPWPCAFASSNYGDIKIHKASIGVSGNVQFDIVQAPGSRTMTWKEFVNGRKDIEFK